MRGTRVVGIASQPAGPGRALSSRRTAGAPSRAPGPLEREELAGLSLGGHSSDGLSAAAGRAWRGHDWDRWWDRGAGSRWEACAASLSAEKVARLTPR
jgi:hypothetical protein